MVSDRRGQLLLIGAVAVGIVVIGTVVFLQGVLYSSTAETQGNDRIVEDVTTGTHAITEDIRTMMDQIQRSGPANYSAALQENISVYSRHYGNMSASDGPAYVNVSINTSRSVGKRVTQSSTAEFTSPSGNSPSWWFINPGEDDADILLFKMNASAVHANQSKAFTVRVANATQSWEFRLSNPGPSSNQTWFVDTKQSGTWQNQCKISTPGTEVKFDMVTGEGAGSCRFPTFVDMNAPYTLRFKNGTEAEGTYRVTAGSVDESNFNTVKSAVVYPAIRVVYEGPQVSIETTTHVNGTEVGS